MKMMWKKTVAILLIVLSVAGLLPATVLAAGGCSHSQIEETLVGNGNGTHTAVNTCKDCGEVILPEVSNETAMIKMDLKQFVKEAAEQEWWDDLRPSVGGNTMFVGNLTQNPTMDPYAEAYAAMLQYLEENECWNIDEETTNLLRGYKRLYLNPLDTVPWGMTLYTYYQGGANAARGDLAFTFYAEKAGTYDLNMDVFKEYSSYTDRANLTDNYPGGAHVDIYVNGELIVEDYSFEDRRNIRLTEYVATVELEEGENSIVFRPLHSYNGPDKLEGGRYNIAFNSIVFVMAPQPVMAEGDTLTVDPKAYVAFGDNDIHATTHTVTSSDKSVATVSFDENDDLVITALRNGISYITVKRGTEETCKITVTVGNTVFCEDAEEDGICDICKDRFSDCKHRKTTVVKTPNGDETTTTVETCDYCGTVVREVTRSDKNILIDFKEAAKSIAQQPWWNDMIDGANADTKYLGSASTTAWMTAEQEAAYASLRAHLEEKFGWTIDEDITVLANARYWKRLFFNASDDVPWGMCYFPIYHNDLPDRSKLALTVKVPEGKAGFYHFDMTVFKENSSYPAGSITGTYGGGGKADIWVNGELVFDEYSFEAANRVFTESMGAVYLHEGDNSVVIQSTVSYNGTINAGRCNLDFCSMLFTPLDPVKVQEYLSASVVLRETYLNYNASIEGFTVKSSNDWIATAELTAAGNVNIYGVTQGTAEIYVMNGETVVCTIPVTVEAFEGTLDELKGSPAKLDFMAVMDKAASEAWWDDLTDADEADTKKITLEDRSLRDWLDINTRWNYTAIEGELTANGGAAKYGVGIEGKVEFAVDLPADGLYNLTVEYLRGGDTVDVSANGETVYEDLDTAGEPAVVRSSLGTAGLQKGINTFTFDAGDGKVCLRSVTLTPLGSWQTEVGGQRYIDLNKTYLPYDVSVAAGFTAVSADTGIVKAAFDTEGELILTGVSEGKSAVTVTGPDGFSAVLVADVIAAGSFKEIVYTIDGFKAETLAVGEVADGELSGVTTRGTPMTDKQLRKYGSTYFVSSDQDVATVDQTTGDVTCVAEGTAVISAYILLDGITARADVTVSVTDDTDLASIEVESEFGYVAVANMLQLTAGGLKASGAAADMSKYPVAWSVDDETVATISEDGVLTGLTPGTVTVTATAGVMRMPVTDSMEIRVVENESVDGGVVMVDFIDGRAVKAQTATLEKDGYEINREVSTNGAKDAKFAEKNGINYTATVGDVLAVDMFVPASGWYHSEIRGALFTGGAVADVYVDDAYLGIMDFCEGRNGVQYDGGGKRNAVWLDAGVHTVRFECTTKGVYYLGRIALHPIADPGTPEIGIGCEDVLLVGQKQTVDVSAKNTVANISFTLKNVEQTPDFTNYYTVSTTTPKVVSVSGNTLTALAVGNAKVRVRCEINRMLFTKTLDVNVVEGSVLSAELTAEETTVKPDAGSVQLSLTAYDVDGAVVELTDAIAVDYTTEDPTIAAVDEDGLVTVKGKEGSVKIKATVVERGREVEAEIWITVTAGKTEPTLFTYEERANAQENVLKYSWAWSEKESCVTMADFVVEHLDQFYDLYFHDVFPRSVQVGWLNDPMAYYCRYCGEYLATNYSVYPWRVDVINNPWKITCPACNRDFPSNDFGAYYESGLDEHGNFSYDLADDSLLVNELYPEMGEGWGVDDGKGFMTTNASGATENHCYIAYYMQTIYCDFGHQSKTTQYGMTTIMDALQRAYLYTGDEKYGSAGAILINRLADIYPGYSITKYSTDYALTDGNSYLGKFIGSIWEATDITQALAQAADAFWPAMDNPDVIEYLRARKAKEGIDPETITPEWVRANVDTGILLEIKKAVETANAYGNFGMHQAGMTYAAVALDRLPETAEMIDWVFRYGERVGSGSNVRSTGGSVLYNIVDLVDRDGFGNEGSAQYNALWYTNLMEVADALSGYTRVEGADLWANPKFVNMVGAMMKLTCCGSTTPAWGESGSVQPRGNHMDVGSMLTGFINSGNRDLAVSIYAANGNSTKGLHGSIFTKDPEGGLQAQIQKIVNEEGPYNFSDSNMMCGLGLGILRDGPVSYLGKSNASSFSDYWMQFGITGGTHAALDSLNIGLDAFGLDLSSGLGYPTVVTTSDPERMQWILSNTSRNTVVVNDHAQSRVFINSFPLHFDDAGVVKLIDAEAPDAYADADIYRRTLVAVDNGDGVRYAVDFFRVLGGTEHVYSFHANTTIDPKVEGLDMVHQAMGTYAGPNIPFGFYQSNPNSTDAAANIGNGYSWLTDVYRDSTPENTFSIDWQIEDFHHRLATSNGIHLKLTMLSEEPMAEVALANGRTPQNTSNPSHLEYALIRKSSKSDMDSLFTSVIEPYQFSSYIAKSELVEVELIEGTEGVTDKAAAIKVTLTSGREDYIVYATNTECLYEIDGRFTFRGFAGVVSYTDGRLTYAYGNEATDVAGVVKDAVPAITGTVVDFTKELADNYYMTIETDQAVTAEDFEGRYIYVENDRVENGAYRIYGAEVKGSTVVLDLYTQDMIRNYVDATNLDSGFVYNIAEGQAFTIPMSSYSGIGTYFTYTTDQVVKAGNKLSLTTGVAGSNVTYQVEGLPTAAKLDAGTGTINWTTSRTHVGRYPVTVKAVQDGEVIAEMSFVIYVVNYTGSVYDASVCSHAKAVIYEVDGIIETVCPACGTVTRSEETDKFDLAGANMTLGNELKLNIMANASDWKAGYVAKITHNGEVTEAEFAKYNSAYYYVFCTVAAAQMADEITVEVFDEEGNAVSNVYTTSVRTYAMNLLGKTTTNAKTKTLLVDMLNYGAAAQENFKYNTSDLANAKLTASQQALATAPVTCTDGRVKGENYYGSSLSLEEKILLNVYFKNVASGMYAEISFRAFDGTKQTVEVPFAEFKQLSGSTYAVVVDDIVLAESFNLVTVTVFNADGTVHGTATDSVESYIARSAASDLNEAIMKFAASAKAYYS